LVLAHLSRENNCPSLLSELFVPQAGNTKIVIASRDEASAVFKVNATESANDQPYIPTAIQPSLF